MRPPKDDPRLSRGLQMLQSKIAILSDLSDRTELQVKQLSLLLDEKSKQVRNTMDLAQEHIRQLEASMQKSLDVAKIFQDKIPHEEIINRQNTVKYVKAAQMAHQGHSIEEIEKVVDISRSELEFLVKVNREKLMFSTEQLPSWIKSELDSTQQAPNPSSLSTSSLSNSTSLQSPQILSETIPVPAAPSEIDFSQPAALDALSHLGNEFRKAVSQMGQLRERQDIVTDANEVLPAVPHVTPTNQTKEFYTSLDKNPAISGNLKEQVRPYTFPRIELSRKNPG